MTGKAAPGRMGSTGRGRKACGEVERRCRRAPLPPAMTGSRPGMGSWSSLDGAPGCSVTTAQGWGSGPAAAGRRTLAGGNAAALQALADLLKAKGSAYINLDEAGHVMSSVPQNLKFEVVASGSPEAEAHNRDRLHHISMGMIDGMEQEGGEHLVAGMSPLSPVMARMVYVGDHLHGDIAAVRRLKGWAAICVAEELENHQPVQAVQMRRLPNAGDLESSSVGHTAVADPFWGDFFTVEGKPTWYAKLMENSAVAAVSDILLLAVP
eukprot:GGOE01053454.1.p1 GENE.GGOE01053454.1~~GGOE01053454.1.p1  ORF type:complete len:266 (+),score=38.31 GGOE01053454.1:461-1258(+)